MQQHVEHSVHRITGLRSPLSILCLAGRSAAAALSKNAVELHHQAQDKKKSRFMTLQSIFPYTSVRRAGGAISPLHSIRLT